MVTKLPLILASASPARLDMLKRINIIPDKIHPADIDETPKKGELPNKLALRLAKEKAEFISKEIVDGYILAADTVSACGRRILPKADNDQDVIDCLKLLSGRRHKVYTGVYLLKIQDKQIVAQSSNLSATCLKFKRLTERDIMEYVASKEGIGKSGGCNIEGLAETFISWVSGSSFSNVIGLPLYETKSLLVGLGYSANQRG